MRGQWDAPTDYGIPTESLSTAGNPIDSRLTFIVVPPGTRGLFAARPWNGNE